MWNFSRKIKHSFAARFSSYLLLLVGLIFSVTFIVSYLFSNRALKSKTEQNVEATLNLLTTHIENILEQVSGTPDNLKHIVFSSPLKQMDYFCLTRIAVENNPFIYGSAIAFEPNYFPTRGYYFSPYSWQRGDSIFTKQLGTTAYHYFDKEWYKLPKELQASYWSNSYYDEEGGNIQMLTYSTPLIDSSGAFAGVFTADLSLEWLNELVKSIVPHEQVSITIMGRDDAVLAVQGNNQNEKVYVYQTEIPQTGWKIYLILPRKVMYEELFLSRIVLLIIGVAGLLLIFIFSINIVKKLIKPLKLFSVSAKQIAHGQLNITLPEINSEDEIAELNHSFRYMQSELLHYIETLKITTIEKERIDSELRVARELQMGMLPKIILHEIDLHAVLYPAKLVGGDLYDFFIRDKKLYFIIGDVSGKGVPAAILMAVTLNMFRAISSCVGSIKEIVSLMNKIVIENNEQNMFVTLFAGILDLQTGMLNYCNAGHDPSVIIRNDVQHLPVIPNLPIGVLPDFEYQSQELNLNFGETLFLYTDGITEAENREHELYGTTRLLDLIRNCKENNTQSLVKAVLKDVKTFVQDYEPSDDLSMLAIRRVSQEKKKIPHTITLQHNISEISVLQKFIEDFCAEYQINSNILLKLNLALEEVISNIIFYAYPEKENGVIELIADYNNTELIFTVTDFGTPFDPTQHSQPETSSSIEERKIGGLGIFLATQIMDTIHYERVGNRNQLTLKKIYHPHKNF